MIVRLFYGISPKVVTISFRGHGNSEIGIKGEFLDEIDYLGKKKLSTAFIGHPRLPSVIPTHPRGWEKVLEGPALNTAKHICIVLERPGDLRQNHPSGDLSWKLGTLIRETWR